LVFPDRLVGFADPKPETQHVLGERPVTDLTLFNQRTAAAAAAVDPPGGGV